MPAIVQSPLLFGSDAIELAANTWAKRLLPVGTVEYKGRTLHFDRDYLNGIVNAFGSGAYDQVPFQLADAANSHTNDPERTRGWVTGMQLRDDGLYVQVQTTEAGNRVLQANPRLGVSARIVEDYARSDGRYYPAAVQHVLGTLDPRIPELGPWQPVEMSNDGAAAGLVIDLSACDWNGEPGYGELEFADGGHPLSPGIRKLAGRLGNRHPATGAAEHAHAAASALDDGDVDGALAHLDGAYGAVPGDGDSPSDREIGDQMARVQASAGHPVTDLQLPDGELDAGRADGGAMTRPKHAADYANDGGGYEFADHTAGYAALELAHQQAALREAEDARDALRLARRRTGTSITEDRLASALGRIGRGTFTPSAGQRALGFANDTVADMVDRAAGQAGGWDASACTCHTGGVPAMTRYHTLGCPEAELTPDMMGELAVNGMMADYAAQPVTDANGNEFRDQYGRPADMTTLLQAYTGERLLHLNDGGFETGHGMHERVLPQRVARFGDPEDGDGQEMTGTSREYIRHLGAQLGLAPQRTADQARDQGLERLAATRARQQPASQRHEYQRQAERDILDGWLGVSGGPAEFANTDAAGQALELINGELPRITLG